MGKVIDASCSDDYLAKTRLEKIGFVFQVSLSSQSRFF